ncbi:phage tail protein [Kosakonia pseudosacchari]|uniref:phage tail protein n=1 Tax=Kosakonia pseudosacchari TaxID=1646340 RepID=UPI001D14D0A7|nr:phage tail protein [Kosakonia pseudosacchari]
MTAKFFAILTNQGAALLANATALGTKLNITQMAVGDGNGTLPTPDATQTKLVNQRRIAPLNMLSVDANNSSQIIAEQVIPENEGGFWIREIGLYDDNGVLIAVANCPETYKPQLQEGSGRTQTIRMVLIVSSTAAVTLKIDPSVVLATRQYADDKAIEVKNYADNLMKQHVADANPHKQYAPVASPVFTGIPKAPTAAKTSNDTQLANTAFVQAAIAALASGELAKKQPLDKTLTELSGKSVEAILEYLGLGAAAKLPSPIFTTGPGYTLFKSPYYDGATVRWFATLSMTVTPPDLTNNQPFSVTFPVAFSGDVKAVLSSASGELTSTAVVQDLGCAIFSLSTTGIVIISKWGARSALNNGDFQFIVTGIINV